MIELAPSFHDGHLTGVVVDEGSARLSLKRANGDAWEVHLIGVDALKMDDFRQGNIVLSVEVTSGAAPEPGPFHRLFEAPHASAASKYHDSHRELISRKMATVEEGAATLFLLTPAYGADMVALCRSVDCNPVPTDGS